GAAGQMNGLHSLWYDVPAQGKSTVPARIVLLLLVLSARPGASAEPGPPPREARFDKNGYLLPAGAGGRPRVPTPLSEFPWSLAWSADGKEFVAGDRSGVTRFDAATGRAIETLTFGDPFRSVYAPLSRDGRLLIFLNGPSATVYDAATGAARGFNLPSPFADAERKAYSSSLSDDCRFLVGIAAPSAQTGVAWRYDQARDKFTRLVNDRADLSSVRISPDGKRLYATGGTDLPELTARDLRNGRELWTVKLKAVGTLRAVSADGRRVATTDSNGITVYEAADGKVVLKEVIDTTTPKGMWAVDLSPDGRRAALSDCRKVTVWDLEAGKVVHRLAHAARLLAFSPDGKSLLTASGWVQNWDLASGKPAFPVPAIDRPVGASVLKWSRDGQRILNVWSGDRSGDEHD